MRERHLKPKKLQQQLIRKSGASTIGKDQCPFCDELEFILGTHPGSSSFEVEESSPTSTDGPTATANTSESAEYLTFSCLCFSFLRPQQSFLQPYLFQQSAAYTTINAGAAYIGLGFPAPLRLACNPDSGHQRSLLHQFLS